MKDIFVVCLVAILFTFGSGTARAAAGWTNAGLITEINQQPASYGGLVFVTASVTGNPGGCSATGFFFSLSDERHKRMFSMLLAAQAAGRQVRIWVTTAPCHEWGAGHMDGVIVIS